MAQVHYVLSSQWLTSGLQESQNLTDRIDWYSEHQVNGRSTGTRRSFIVYVMIIFDSYL